MKNNARVTIIIPAYNAASRIARTLDSVLAQTLRDIVVWVVDDGSTDKTSDVVHEFEMRDARVRLFRQENQGCYAARVNAWKKVETEYVGFVDADDTIEPNMYERLVAFADKYHLEVAQCDQCGDSVVAKEPELFLSKEDVLQHVSIPRLIVGEGQVTVWDKLYRTGVHCIGSFEPANILMGEDLAINLQFFRGLSRVGYLHEPLYHYDINEGSSVKNFREKNIRDFEAIIRFRNLFCSAYGYAEGHPVMCNWVLKNLLNNLLSAIRAPALDADTRISNVRKLLSIPALGIAMRAQGGLRIRAMKMLLVLVRIMPRLMIPALRLSSFIRNKLLRW